jgi:uncharacterized protein (UPF0147 family)
MDKVTVTLDMKHTEMFIDMANMVSDITKDERIPADVREEIMDKVNLITESRQDG